MERLAEDVQRIELSGPQEQQLNGNGSVSQNFISSRQCNSFSFRSKSHIKDEDTVNDKVRREVGLDEANVHENGDHSSEDESDDEEYSSDDDDIKAPIELIGEFLHYVRTSDWENAAKLCKMILIYEPENSVALQFQTVIEEKAKIEKELAEISSSSEDDSSSDEEDTSSDEDEIESEDAEENRKDEDGEPDDTFEPRPGSKMKNPLIFPYNDPVWKP